MLLPTSRASLVTFFALQAERRVPAMLNFSTGPASAIAACRGAEIALIVTARRFIEKAKLQALVAALEPHATIVYLEDVRGEIGSFARLGALARSLASRRRATGPSAPTIPAVVLFTSGSEGTPKGVVLSHRNLLANRHQLASVVDISPKDVVFNALPVFHSFGLTGGLLHAAARRRAHVPLSVAAALPDGAGVRLRHRTRRSSSAPTRSSPAMRVWPTTTTSTRCATSSPAPSA